MGILPFIFKIFGACGAKLGKNAYFKGTHEKKFRRLRRRQKIFFRPSDLRPLREKFVPTPMTPFQKLGHDSVTKVVMLVTHANLVLTVSKFP